MRNRIDNDKSRLTPDAERLLVERLQEEAGASRPKFSDGLHAQIMQAIRQVDDASPPAVLSSAVLSSAVPTRSGSAEPRRIAVFYWIAIAACLAVLAAGLWQWNRSSVPVTPESKNEVASAVEPDDEELGDLAAFDLAGSLDSSVAASDQIESLMGATLPGYSWEDLDQDTRLVARLVVDQLPLETPADEWGLPSLD